VGHIEPSELADERLKLEKRLEAPLARLGLVGSVSGVEFASPRDGIDHGRNEMIVAATAEETDGAIGGLIRGSQLLDVLRQFHLGQGRRHVEWPVKAHSIGHQFEEFFDGLYPDALQHGALIIGGVENVQTDLLRMEA